MHQPNIQCMFQRMFLLDPHDSEELLLHAVGPCGNAYLSQNSHIQLIFVNCTCPIGFNKLQMSVILTFSY